MKRWLIWLGMAWASTLPIHGYCEKLSLEAALQTALHQNPQIKAAQARLGISDAEIVTAGTRLNPNIVSDNGIAEKTYRLGIEQTIELGGKRKRRVELSEANRQVVLAEINIIVLDVRGNVRRAYTRLYTAQQRLDILKDILATTNKLLKVAEVREKAGDIARLDVLQSEIATINASNDLQSAEYDVAQARNSLNALLNKPLDNIAILETPPIVPSIYLSRPLLIQAALHQRPEIVQNEQGLEVTRRLEALSKANRIPNLSLTAGPDVVIGSEKAVNAFIVGNLQVPVFNRQQGQLQEARARQTQLRLEQEALKNRIATEVSNADLQYTGSRERISRYEKELLPRAKFVLDKSRRSFQEGKTSILIPITAQQAFINTRLGYLQALQDLQNAIGDLERAVGAGL